MATRKGGAGRAAGSERAGRVADESTRWIRAILRFGGDHPALRAVLDTIERLQDRPHRTNVLLLGEAGTGKEGLARALHRAMGSHGAIVELQASGRSDAAVLGDLFGANGRGGLAARADRGTIFVDDVGGLGGDAQALVYRLIKRGELPGEAARRVDVRMIAGAGPELASRAQAGAFRHDLYYRLARIVLQLPPLRQRREDIGRLAIWVGNRILEGRGDARHLQVRTEFDPKEGILLGLDAIAELEGYAWPGNLRELDAVLERVLALYLETNEITGEHVRRALEETGGARLATAAG